MERRTLGLVLVGWLAACAGPPKPEPFHYREADEPAAPPAAAPAPEAASEPAAEHAESETPGAGEALGSLREAPPLPAELDAGAIARPELEAVLAQGIARFLQKVHTEPMRNAQGRFVGWRLLELFRDDPRGAEWVIRPGDVVVRVNGHSIERPEQFQNVWNSVATSSELVFSVLRGDQTSEIRYRIQ